jgi:hypothetical protein
MVPSTLSGESNESIPPVGEWVDGSGVRAPGFRPAAINQDSDKEYDTFTMRRVSTPATYPNYAGKHAEEAMFTPADFAAYLRRVGMLGDYDPPDGIVLCYQRSLLDHILKTEGLERSHRQGALASMRRLPSTQGRIGVVGQFGIGAPAAAAALEELAALGTERFISIGTAGSLQRDLPVGEVVVCEDAIRDEGVSHHYLPPAMLVSASKGLTAARSCLRRVRPYRSAPRDDRHSISRDGCRGSALPGRGVLCVEMEAAVVRRR